MKKLIAMILILMCLPAACAANLPAAQGMEAPDFELKLISGETFRLSDQRGKVVMINIWATWCPPCVAEMPDIDRLAQDYADDLVVIGVNCGEDEDTIREFVSENGYSYLFAADEDYTVSGLLYPTSAIPYTVIVDAQGIVVQTHRGGGEGMYEVFEGYVKQALRSAKSANGVEILA